MADSNDAENGCLDFIERKHSKPIYQMRMIRSELREFVGLIMVSDPWPDGVDEQTVKSLADDEAKAHGFTGWVQAWHEL